jgi:hypothetical protein
LHKHGYLDGETELFEGKSGEIALAVKTRSKQSGMDRVKNFRFLLEDTEIAAWTVDQPFRYDGRLLKLIDCDMKRISAPWVASDRLGHTIRLKTKEIHQALTNPDEQELIDVEQAPKSKGLPESVIKFYSTWG